ncbi:hypothetical protein Sste5346_004393 [Sporothrix stenoceras]|uniref:Alternative oxidase n=1 Tax=Sporothrix stenoceras TaxID=5173 RepID=A0ABR3Z9L3_9PEZI
MNLNGLLRWAHRGLSGAASKPHLRIILIYSISVVLALFIILKVGGIDSFRAIPHIIGTNTHTSHQTDLSLPDAPFISWPLARICQETIWRPGLVFACNNNSGGIGNIRNFVLTCLRYAITVGATGLVLPQIETRSETDLVHLFGGRQPFEYFFDTNHFKKSLHEACPAIAIYDSIETIPNLAKSRAEPLQPKAFGARGGCDYRDLNRHTDIFRIQFDEMLEQTSKDFSLAPLGIEHPRLFQPVWGVQWEWPVAKDGPAFTNTFGGLLRFRDNILRLGDDVVAAMTKKSQAFSGVHLRTENDALSFWPTFETQTSEFIRTLLEKKLLLVYLATGNATEAAKFRDRAQEQGMQVFTKDELLQNQPALQQLQALTWDQQALVDYIVLLRGDFFLGVSPSSFSMTIAAKRHLTAGNDGMYTRPWLVNGQGDAWSRLVGNYTSYWDDWLFMYDALWP